MNLDVQIQTIVSALGYVEKASGEYKKEPDCKDLVNDLSYLLKHDSERQESRRIMLATNVVQGDLVHILAQHSNDEQLFTAALKVAANLTQPAVVCFGGRIPRDASTFSWYTTVYQHLVKMKSAFINIKFMQVLADRLQKFLDQDWTEREEEDALTVDRMLLLLRNVVHICGAIGVNDNVTETILNSGLPDLFLYITSSRTEKKLHTRVVEIIMLILNRHTPKELVESIGVRSIDERKAAEQIMNDNLEKQVAIDRERVRKCTARHSNFAGSYVVLGVKSVSQKNDVVSHRIVDPKHVNHMPWIDDRKKPKRTAKNKAPVVEQEVGLKGALKLRQGLLELSEEFVQMSYNQCMMTLRAEMPDALVHDPSKLQESESVYYWCMAFMLQVCLLRPLSLDRVSDSLTLASIHKCQTTLDQCLENCIIQKKEAKEWGKRGHMALKAYKQIMHCIIYMTQPNAGQAFNEQAKSLQGNIFYETEYRDLCLNVLKQYQPWNLSKNFLKDLVETAHIYLRMLEKHMKIDGNQLVVKKKRKKGTKKKKANKNKEKEDAMSEEVIEEIWEEISSELCSALQGHANLPSDVTPFDSAMDDNQDNHVKVALGRIQSALRSKKPLEAVALLRSAKELWPNREEFGTEQIDAEEEFLLLKKVHSDAEFTYKEEEEEQNEDGFDDEFRDGFDEIDEEMGDVDVDRTMIVSEVHMQFDEYVCRFARPDILKWYVALLADYKSNSRQLNKQIIKMLHRIVVDLKLTPILFQAKLFRIFQEFSGKPRAFRDLEQFKEMKDLGNYVVGLFFRQLAKEPKLAAELLFWKNTTTVYEIENGYGSYESSKKSKKGKMGWEEEEALETHIRTLYYEFNDMPYRSEELTRLDYIEMNLNVKLSQKQIKSRLKGLGIGLEEKLRVKSKKKSMKSVGIIEDNIEESTPRSSLIPNSDSSDSDTSPPREKPKSPSPKSLSPKSSVGTSPQRNQSISPLNLSPARISKSPSLIRDVSPLEVLTELRDDCNSPESDIRPPSDEDSPLKPKNKKRKVVLSSDEED